MSDIFHFSAEMRDTHGTAEARRLRQQERVPAVIYGAGKETSHVSLSHKDVLHALQNEAVYSHILTVDIAGKQEQVVLKDLARHPSRPRVLHVDFLRIKAKEKITMNVPLHVLGEDVAPGLKAGGVMSKLMNELEIRCLPGDLPESIDIDISAMELGQVVHLSDIKLPKGVELTVADLDEEHDHPVISIHAAKAAAEEEETEAAAEGGDEAEEKSDSSEDKPEE